MKQTVVVKGNKSGLSVILDAEIPFEQLLQDVGTRFRKHADFWGNVQMILKLEGRKLTARQEFQIVNQITANSQIDIVCLIDRDSDNIQKCEKTLNEKLMELSSRTGQFYKGHLSARDVLESEVSIVVIGNIEKGAKVISKGNVIVLGAIRGNVSAGVAGDESAVISALEMEPLQLRIAGYVARYTEAIKRNYKHPVMVCVEQGQMMLKPMKKSFFPQ